MKNSPIVIFALPAFLLLAGCRGKQESGSIVPDAVPDITVAYPLVDSVTLYKTYPGYLAAIKSVDLIGRVSGYQLASPYTPGVKVRKGDTLFVIEPTQYEDAVEQAEAELETARSQLYYAENNYTRMKEAAQSNAISAIDLIKSESAYHQAESAVKNAEAALQTARTQLGYCFVLAPFDGKVTASVYGNGAFINGGASTVLAKIYQDDKLYAYFNIDDVQYMRLVRNRQNNTSKDNPISVELLFNENLPHAYTGYIDYMAPNVNLSTGTMQIRVVVENKFGELKDGLYANIRLPYGEDKQAVLVADASIGSDQVGRYVYVVNDSNRVETRHIETGDLYQDTLRIVKSGLSPHDRYVTQALMKVRDGMEVHPVIETSDAE